MRKLILPSAVAAIGALILAWNALLTQAFTDYELEVEPSFDALRAGDLSGFLDRAPVYGGSLILRAPFVLASELLGGGSLSAFRAAAIPCLLAGVAFAVFLFLQVQGRGKWLALGLAAFNPVTLRALEIGHPEELLGAVLCVSAVLCALGDRPGWAGLLLGLAIANKAWAVIAIGPVLVALDHGRLRAMAIAGGLAAIVVLPVLISAHESVTASASSSASTIFQPWQIWWFFGDAGTQVVGTDGVKEGYRAGPEWVTAVARPLLILMAVPLTALFWRLKRDRADALGLLALLFALRCLLDFWDAVYYSLPLLMALLAWEARDRRAPLFTTLATVLVWFSFELAPGFLSPDLQSLTYLAWMLPVVAALCTRVFAPERFEQLENAVRARLARSLPTLARLNLRLQPSNSYPD